MIACPQCGAERFILPRSPYPEIEETATKAAAGAAGRRSWTAALWRLPLAAAILTATILAVVWWVFLFPETKHPEGPTATDKKTAAEHLLQARQYLAGGMFRLAANELEGEPSDLPADQKPAWRQLQREAALLADLCAEPLEEILQHAAGVGEREWQADFPRRYRGKSIIFDTVILRKANGKLQALYVFPRSDKIHLEIGDLELFRHLPLDQPRRVLFGGRLATINLEPPGPAWVVHFQAESGVLLTDARAAGLCCPALNEPDALRILAEQAKLVP
jgi:hypothetical protein